MFYILYTVITCINVRSKSAVIVCQYSNSPKTGKLWRKKHPKTGKLLFKKHPKTGK